MVMRVRLTIGVYSLSFKVRLKVLALYPNLTSVANLEPYEISADDEATDCLLRDLECVSHFPKRKKLQCTPHGYNWT